MIKIYLSDNWKQGLTQLSMIWLAFKDCHKELRRVQAPLGWEKEVQAQLDKAFVAIEEYCKPLQAYQIEQLWRMSMQVAGNKEGYDEDLPTKLSCFRDLVCTALEYCKPPADDNPYME